MSKNSWVKPLGKTELDKWRKLLSKRKEYDYALQTEGWEEEAEEVGAKYDPGQPRNEAGQFAGGFGASEPPHWASNEGQIVEGYTVFKGKYAAKNDYAVVTDDGQPGPFRKTPEEAVSAHEQVLDKTREFARAHAEYKGALAKVKDGDMSQWRPLMGGERVTTSHAKFVLRDLGVSTKVRDKIVYGTPVVHESKFGTVYYDTEIMGERYQRLALGQSKSLKRTDTLPPGVIEQQPRSDVFWVFMQPDDQTPYVLGKEAVDKDWLPPKGVSALPKVIRERVPKELRFWETSGKEALDRRAKLAEMDVRELGGSSAKQLDWKPYYLQRHWFRGPIQVRFGASDQHYDLRIVLNGKHWHLVIDGNPLTNDRLPAYEETKYSGNVATVDGKRVSVLRIGTDPVELAPGQPANPTKDTPAFIQTVDEGEARVLDSQPEFTKLEFKDGKLKGAWYFRLELPGSKIGEFGKSEGPATKAKSFPEYKYRIRRKNMDLTYVYACKSCGKDFEVEQTLEVEPVCPDCSTKALPWQPYLLQRHNDHHDLRIGDDFTLRLSGTLLDNEPDKAEVSTESPALQGADGQAVDALKVKPGDPVKLSDGEIQTMDAGQARYAKTQSGHQVEFKGGKLEGVYLFGPEGAHPVDLEHIDVEWEPGQPEPAPAEPEGDGHPPLFPFEPPQLQPFHPPLIPFNPPPPVPPLIPPPGQWWLGDGEVAEGEKFSQPRDDFGRFASTGGGGGVSGGGEGKTGRAAAEKHKISEHEAATVIKRAGDGAEKQERAKYEIRESITRPNEYHLLDSTKIDSAGVRKTIKTGDKPDLEKEVDKRAKTARTRVENQAESKIQIFNSDITHGFYDDLPEGAGRDKERILSGKAFEEEPEEGEKVGKRIKTEKLSKLQELRNSLESAVKWLSEVIGWGSYEDAPQPTMLEFFKGSDAGFTVKTVQGEPWLFTWSANAFKDREGEIFSTKALENWADAATARQDKGTFNFWHIPGSDFATKRWVGVPGRILVEAGPFTQDAKGKAAQAFFAQYPDRHPTLAPEGWGCSVEYRYLPEERKSKVYRNVEITRTSVLPRFAAANTWTAVKEVTMALTDAQKKAAQELFGEDLAASILGEAEAKTKELEPNVAHKGEGEQTEPEATPEVQPEAAVTEEAQSVTEEVKAKDEETIPEEDKAKKRDKKQVDKFVKALADIAGQTDDEGVKKALQTTADKLTDANAADEGRTLKMLAGRVKDKTLKTRLQAIASALVDGTGYPAPGDGEAYPAPTKSKEFVEAVAAELAPQFQVDMAPIGEAMTKVAASLKSIEDRVAALEQSSGRKAATDLPRFVFGLVEQASKADATIVPEGDKLLEQKPKETSRADVDGSIAAHFFPKGK